jgi:hypothetical protein
MRLLDCLIATLVLTSPQLQGQVVLEDVARSHIEANVPAQELFASLLTRDLTAFFRAREPDITTVEYELLRAEPTQTGIAYPKYYAWVRVLKGKDVAEEGVVRLAAVERKQFDVLQFLSRAEITDDPSAVAMLFPRPLVEGILKRAARVKG